MRKERAGEEAQDLSSKRDGSWVEERAWKHRWKTAQETAKSLIFHQPKASFVRFCPSWFGVQKPWGRIRLLFPYCDLTLLWRLQGTDHCSVVFMWPHARAKQRSWENSHTALSNRDVPRTHHQPCKVELVQTGVQKPSYPCSSAVKEASRKLCFWRESMASDGCALSLTEATSPILHAASTSGSDKRKSWK